MSFLYSGILIAVIQLVAAFVIRLLFMRYYHAEAIIVVLIWKSIRQQEALFRARARSNASFFVCRNCHQSLPLYANKNISGGTVVEQNRNRGGIHRLYDSPRSCQEMKSQRNEKGEHYVF